MSACSVHDRPEFGCPDCINTARTGDAGDTADLSADQRRTRRNQQLLDAGLHPATRTSLRADASTCGDCSHHHAYRNHRDGLWHKCELHRLGEGHSAASDIRVNWPACTHYEPEEQQ